MAKLMKPLFINGMFNKEGKRIRANYLKTIKYNNIEYPLWINDGKPDKDYARNENDKYYLYIQVNDWIIMFGYTEYDLELRAGQEELNKVWYGSFEGREKYFKENIYNNRTFKEYNNLVKAQIEKENTFISEYGKYEDIQAEFIQKFINKTIQNYIEARDNNGKIADFIGATFLNELDRCVEIASILRKERQENELKRKRIKAEQEEKERKEQEYTEQLLIEETEKTFINGGTIEGGDIIVKLANKYGVNIPLRTKGWILNSFAECTVTENGGMSYRYWKKKGTTGSKKIYDVLSSIRSKIIA